MAHPEMSDQPEQILLPPTAQSLWQQYVAAARSAAEMRGVRFEDYEVAGDRLVRAEDEQDGGE
jgi:hypothetical protein